MRLTFDVPQEYMRGLNELMRPYVTRSDVCREAIRQHLIAHGKVTDTTVKVNVTSTNSEPSVVCPACVATCHDLCVSKSCPCVDGEHPKRK